MSFLLVGSLPINKRGLKFMGTWLPTHTRMWNCANIYLNEFGILELGKYHYLQMWRLHFALLVDVDSGSLSIVYSVKHTHPLGLFGFVVLGVEPRASSVWGRCSYPIPPPCLAVALNTSWSLYLRFIGIWAQWPGRSWQVVSVCWGRLVFLILSYLHISITSLGQIIHHIIVNIFI